MRIARLGDHVKQVRGITYQSGDAIESADEGYLPILRSNNIEEGTLNFDGLIYVPEKLVKEHQKILAGDLLLTASTGSKKVIGKNGAATKDMDASFGAFCKVIRAKESIDQGYLKHFFQTPYYRRSIQDVVNGANINNIKTEHINDLKIHLPPLSTQKKIAAILDSADAHRQKTKQLLAKYDELAQSIFLEMFGDPVTNPKGWEVKRLEDCTKKIGSGATPRGGKDAYKDEGISLIRSLNIHDNEFKLKNLALIDEEQANDLKNVIVEKGDVLFNITGASVCRCCIVPEEILPARVNQHVSILRPSSCLASEYLMHFMNSKNQKVKLFELATKGGATREAITKQDLQDMEILVPDLALQKKFSLTMDNLKEQVLNLLKESDMSESLFNSLLQKAFKGELVE